MRKSLKALYICNMETVNRVRLRENSDKLKRMSDLMKVMGNSSRLAIVDLLIEQNRLPVGDISQELDLSQSSTSQHLKALERIGALESEREGTFIFYKIKNHLLETLISCANECTDC
jgi:DNA-binding transcriptional ArsR family regulator